MVYVLCLCELLGASICFSRCPRCLSCTECQQTLVSGLAIGRLQQLHVEPFHVCSRCQCICHHRCFTTALKRDSDAWLCQR